MTEVADLLTGVIQAVWGQYMSFISAYLEMFLWLAVPLVMVGLILWIINVLQSLTR